MRDYAGVRELAELVFERKSTIHEKRADDFSMTEDFSMSLNKVLFFRRIIVFNVWRDVINKERRKILSSHEDYLTFVISACFSEHEHNRKIFDAFISVLSLLLNVSEHIFLDTGIDFRDLNPDIFLLFFWKILKKDFPNRGFYRFSEYISSHKYLSWISNRDATVKSILNESMDKIREETSWYISSRRMPDVWTSPNIMTARSFAQKVLSTSSVELSVLPSESDLITILVACRKREITEDKRISEVLLKSENSHKDSSFNFNAETNYFAKQKENIARHENIIKSVIRHNHSKNSDYKNVNAEILENADGILDHLKSMVTSLVEVLDECDKE